jgi:hypothetical protein
VESPERERRAIIEYFESQNREGMPVKRAEKITTESIYGRKHDVWDVDAQDGRWWVITDPTNLYRQDDFPSMHAAFALHIGVTARMQAHEALRAPVNDEDRERYASAWRCYEQAAVALDKAEEAEDFQAVGMRCCECLLAFAAAVADDSLVPEATEAPKTADFVNWTELFANAIAHGARATRVRRHLKALSKSTWELVSWLTHEKNATRFDGILAADATSNLLTTFTMAELRFERGETDRCPSCGSYQLSKDYDKEHDVEFPYCKACDWVGPPVE